MRECETVPRLVTTIAWVLLAVGAAGAAPRRAQHVAPPASTWLAALDHYLAGDYADATRVVESFWTGDLAQEVQTTLTAIGKDAARHARASEEHRRAVQRVRAAVLVPLEALLPLSARVSYDARFAPLESALRQALTALDAIDPLDPSAPSPAGAFRHWAQIGLMQFLLNSGQLAEFERLAGALRIADSHVEVRAELYVLRGMAHERSGRLVTSVRTMAPSYIPDQGQGLMGLGGGTTPSGSTALRSDRAAVSRRYFRTAADWYERALKLRPSHEEGRLHLGRTWLDRLEAQRAIDTLEPLTAAICVTSPCGLALLFTGEAHETLGAEELARDFYLRASGIALVRQTALVASTHQALRQGRASSLTLALQFRDRAPMAQQDVPDAWGVYVSGRRTPEAVLTALRAELTR